MKAPAGQLTLELPALTVIAPRTRRHARPPASVMAPTRLTLGDAARIMREAVKDKSYRSTPVGLEVAHFIRWFRNEYGATTETLRDYEAILAKLAIDHADLELRDFEPPDGTTRLREFIDERWGEAAPRTRKKVRAVLMSFFKWAQAEFKLHGNPVVPIRSPRLRDVERELFSAEDVARIVESQPELRDRVALKLLFLMGLRKGELAATRYRDFDLGRRRLRVHGKGGKIRHTPIPTEELRQEIAHAYPVSSVRRVSYGRWVPRPAFLRSVIEFQHRFPDEEACRAYLFASRWPDGFVCPACGGGEVGGEHRRHLWQCKSCGYQVSVTAGTVMHKTRLPLTLWFWAGTWSVRMGRGSPRCSCAASSGSPATRPPG